MIKLKKRKKIKKGDKEMFYILLGLICFAFAFWVLIYECIVNINIIKACNIYINKSKYQKLQKEVNSNEPRTND